MTANIQRPIFRMRRTLTICSAVNFPRLSVNMSFWCVCRTFFGMLSNSISRRWRHRNLIAKCSRRRQSYTNYYNFLCCTTRNIPFLLEKKTFPLPASQYMVNAYAYICYWRYIVPTGMLFPCYKTQQNVCWSISLICYRRTKRHWTGNTLFYCLFSLLQQQRMANISFVHVNPLRQNCRTTTRKSLASYNCDFSQNKGNNNNNKIYTASFYFSFLYYCDQRKSNTSHIDGGTWHVFVFGLDDKRFIHCIHVRREWTLYFALRDTKNA